MTPEERYLLEDIREFRRVAKATMPGPMKLNGEQRLSRMLCPKLRDFAKKHDLNQNVIITGKSRFGKSMATLHLAARNIRDFARRSPDGTRYRSTRIVNATLVGKLTYGQVDFSVGSEVDLCCRVKTLVINDLGWETNIGVEALVAIIDHRYARSDLVTWVTTGKTIAELTERYSEAVVARLTEAGGRHGVILDLWKETLEPMGPLPPAIPFKRSAESEHPIEIVKAEEIDSFLRNGLRPIPNRATMRESLDKQKKALLEWEGAAE